jgi:hypothetical protein
MNSDKLSEAIDLIKKGEKIKKVARDLDIEYHILYHHIKGNNRSFNKGRPFLLPYDVETELIDCATYLASRNLGLNFRRFKNFAKDIYRKLHPIVSEDKMPKFSLQWWRNFKKKTFRLWRN